MAIYPYPVRFRLGQYNKNKKLGISYGPTTIL